MKQLRARKYGTKLSSTLLALLFAGLWLFAQNFEVWNSDWAAKLNSQAPVTIRLPARYFRITMLNNRFHYLSTSSSACSHLVERGAKLKPGKECARLAVAYDNYRRQPTFWQPLGSFALYFIIALLLATAMRLTQNGRSRTIRGQLAVFSLMTLLLFGSKTLLLFTSLSAFVLPVVAIPLLAAHFFVKRLGYVLVLVVSFLAASFVNFDIEVMLVHLVTGMAAVYVFHKRHRARYHLKAGFAASGIAIAAALITTLIFSGTIDVHDSLQDHFHPHQSRWLAALFGSIGSGIIAWLLTPVAGLMLGAVSRSKLVDLQDLDQRLLNLLRERAPSTWEHSRAIANLAEAAAHAIGADALLVRVGAYYHDAGKTVRPDYFIENQGGAPNPHDEMMPLESANCIFQHVVEGAKMLRQEGIPEDIVEFCYSHHGTSVLEYFWHKTMASGNSDELTERDFVYPGHKPTSRETGIMMVVDSIEAAARTIDNPEKSKFQALIQQVIFAKLHQGQLDETGLSVADLRIIASTLTDSLASMYHARIKYPWQTEDTGAMDTKELEAASKRVSSTPPPAHTSSVPPNPTKRTSSTPPPVASETSQPEIAVSTRDESGSVDTPTVSDTNDSHSDMSPVSHVKQPVNPVPVENQVPTIPPPAPSEEDDSGVVGVKEPVHVASTVDTTPPPGRANESQSASKQAVVTSKPIVVNDTSPKPPSAMSPFPLAEESDGTDTNGKAATPVPGSVNAQSKKTNQ